MLEIKLERAMASDQLEEDSCGMCGVDFRPAAVVATLAVDSHCQPVCEPCLKHLAERDDASPVPANWGDVYDRYTRAVREYPELYFPTLDALLEHEAACDGYADYSEMQKV